MGGTTEVGCSCGQTRIEVQGPHIAAVECCCTSCQIAGERLRRLEAGQPVLTVHGATPFVMYRKDRVQFLAGSDLLKSFRLSPDASTRRVIATCCNAPVFLEFKGGPWLSLYGGLWPDGTCPAPQLRTMTADLPAGYTLPDDIPNVKKHNLGFFAKLFGAWAAMGFRNPKMPRIGELDA